MSDMSDGIKDWMRVITDLLRTVDAVSGVARSERPLNNQAPAAPSPSPEVLQAFARGKEAARFEHNRKQIDELWCQAQDFLQQLDPDTLKTLGTMIQQPSTPVEVALAMQMKTNHILLEALSLSFDMQLAILNQLTHKQEGC